MAQVFLDDRPIQPNKEYLEQKQLQHRQKKQFHHFLKKQSTDQVLPCFRQNIKHPKKPSFPRPQKNKTKAQIYAEIKRINIEKFGDKNDRKKEKENQLKNKKIDPLKMTISYKPKSAIIIDTNQYKRKSRQKPTNQEEENLDSEVKPAKAQQSPAKHEENAKDKYEKLLNFMRKQRLELTKQKQDFQKHKQKLQFKKIIQCEDSIPFIDEIKKTIQEKNKLRQSHRIQCKAHKDFEENSGRQKLKNKNQNDQIEKNANKEKDLNKIQSRISKLSQQKQEIESEVYKNKRNSVKAQNEEDDFISTKYSLEQVNQTPAYDIECFRDFIDMRTLQPQGNEFYKIALKVFEKGVDVKQAKIKQRIQNLDRINENFDQNAVSVDYKRKYEGQTRITKYNNGWIEVWTPGVQRLMANKELGYKVVWLKNGDIRQQWKDKKVESYFSKAREVAKLKFDKHEPIYYFTQLKQLEQYNHLKKIKTVMFKEGRIETFSTEEEPMDGFTI